MNDFEILKWDSEFFDLKVVKVGNNFLSNDLKLKLKFLYEKNADLIYYTSTVEKIENFENQYYDISLVSTRVPLIKKINKITEIHPNISLYDKLSPDENLISLAHLAGRQGRFGMDSRISKNIYNKIFENWMINSINKKMADEVLVYKDNDVIVGFATIKIDGNKGYVPLLAVDRPFEGKGVSFALMRAVETRLVESGCEYLLSGTQEKNKKALAAFSRFGVELKTPEYVYHLWRKK
tara:strand:+ start:601 stop:1311 length:711 start_codon:yes stop_codon:yes gene_type:complete